MEYDKDLYKTLEDYYKILENVGYYDKPIDNILVLDFLNDFVDTCSDFITEQDIKLINSIIPCLENCLVHIHLLNYNQQKLITKEDVEKTAKTLRKTENHQTRLTEKVDYRSIE